MIVEIGIADVAETLDIGGVTCALVGDVQPGHHHRNASTGRQFRRFRVDVNIKFRSGRPVTLVPLRRP